jgi:hypothetical protein
MKQVSTTTDPRLLNRDSPCKVKKKRQNPNKTIAKLGEIPAKKHNNLYFYSGVDEVVRSLKMMTGGDDR